MNQDKCQNQNSELDQVGRNGPVKENAVSVILYVQKYLIK